jgi:hypothetical protein
VAMAAGRHRVEWEERVPGLEISRWGPVLFGVIVAGLFVASRRRRPA